MVAGRRGAPNPGPRRPSRPATSRSPCLGPALVARGWWARQDSNLRQRRYERRVLTAELRARGRARQAARAQPGTGEGHRSTWVTLEAIEALFCGNRLTGPMPVVPPMTTTCGGAIAHLEAPIMPGKLAAGAKLAAAGAPSCCSASVQLGRTMLRLRRIEQREERSGKSNPTHHRPAAIGAVCRLVTIPTARLGRSGVDRRRERTALQGSAKRSRAAPLGA